jgi:hypothetical protein
MTMLTQDAGIVDLRSAWLPLRSFAWSSAGDEVDDDGDGSPSGAPDSPADDDAEDTDAGGEADDETRDKDRRRLSREAAKYRTTAKAEKERADGAEARATSLEELVHGLIAQNAFLRAAGGTIADVDAAWKLADHDSLTVNEDGTVEGVDDVLTQVTERYPYLTKQPSDVDPVLADKFPALVPSGRPTNGKRQSDTGALNVAALAAKFPALGRHKR